ncbi:hypothetical protein GOBAR_AA33447 [Gossypium barbadense]|uniref:Longin domain-containing protein n=1 Tax=Gossypium barbadense TaxID=3634 RepID=A0A2P5W841_GOSBA|nr:hypothetical protein GOBAR_AA33447 [Gossypium barbadense]
MKITSLLVLKCNPEGSDPIILANATDVSHFGYFQRSSVREFIVFVARTVAKRTPPGQRQSVQHEGGEGTIPKAEYKVHAYNRNGLVALGFMDDHYPVRSAFSLLNQVLDEYLKNFGESWRTVQADVLDEYLKNFGESWRTVHADSAQSWPYLEEALDPAEADKLLKIQRELDETKIILHKTIDSVLERGEKLDSLVEKSSDLSAASQMLALLGWLARSQMMDVNSVPLTKTEMAINSFSTQPRARQWQSKYVHAKRLSEPLYDPCQNKVLRLNKIWN